MRKSFAIIAVFALLATTANAQLKWGLKGGLNITNMKFDESAIKPDNRAGFFIGPMAEFTVPIVGVGADIAVLYNQKSLKVEESGLEESETLHYIDLPINLKWSFGIGSTAGVYIATGPQFSFYLGDKTIFDDIHSVSDASTTGQEMAKGMTMKSSVFSWNIGAGVKLLGHLQIGYNYNIGLGKTSDQELTIGNVAGQIGSTTWNLIKGKTKSNTHQISIAYIF